MGEGEEREEEGRKVMKTAYVAHNFAAKDWLLAVVRGKLKSAGISLNSRWIHTTLGPGEGGKQSAEEDLEDIRSADFLIYFAAGLDGGNGLGKHIELGYALAIGKRVVLIQEHSLGGRMRESVFYLLDQVIQFQDINSFVGAVAREEFVP